ncbi:MAG: hypothetical protein ACTHL3_01770 [Candidatus Nitrosocosmicus sp.]
MNGFQLKGTIISISFIILIYSLVITNAFAQNNNSTILSTKSDNESSVFLFVYTESGGKLLTDKRISFNSFTGGLVSIDNSPAHTYQIKTLSNSTIENIKKIFTDNDLFSINKIYHTAATDIPVQKLLVVINGKVISTEINIPGPVTEQKPKGLINFIDAIRNASLSK